MAIYHLEAKVISRGTGRSAVAASAYMSCSDITNDYDGIHHDYTKKHGLVWENIFLPSFAPDTWKDRGVLWNAVEAEEKTKDSRLAREFVVALPIELSREAWIKLLTDYINDQFVSDGMCADVAIHDTDGHNPHAHILLTVRPLTAEGKWQYKTEKEYLCIRGDEERGFTSSEFSQAEKEGWEKQYQYKSSRKKVYMTPSKADSLGLERVSKYPKSTRYGRQNPISARWNREDQLLIWRENWAIYVNNVLDLAGKEDRIDHRSHKDRGIDEQPTIHEGVASRILENNGIISDRVELNRQIKRDNSILRQLKESVKKLASSIKTALPDLAEAMESLRANMIVFKYQLRHIGINKGKATDYINTFTPALSRYDKLQSAIKEAVSKRKSLKAELKSLSVLNIIKRHELEKSIATLTEDIEEMKSERSNLMIRLGCDSADEIKEVRDYLSGIAGKKEGLSKSEETFNTELDITLEKYRDLEIQGESHDAEELSSYRLEIRPAREQEAINSLINAYGEKYSYEIFKKATKDVAGLLGEPYHIPSMVEELNRSKAEVTKPDIHKSRVHNRNGNEL